MSNVLICIPSEFVELVELCECKHDKYIHYRPSTGKTKCMDCSCLEYTSTGKRYKIESLSVVEEKLYGHGGNTLQHYLNEQIVGHAYDSNLKDKNGHLDIVGKVTIKLEGNGGM